MNNNWELRFDKMTEGAVDLAPRYITEAEEWLIKNPEKHLFEDKVYGEPMFDLSIEKVKEFIRQERTALLEGIMEEIKCKMPIINTIEELEYEADYIQGLSVAISIIDSRMGEINK